MDSHAKLVGFVFLVFVAASCDVSLPDDLISAETLAATPLTWQDGRIAADLSFRVDDKERSTLALIVSLCSEKSETTLFNPFFIPDYGTSVQLVITDKACRPVAVLAHATALGDVIAPPDAWLTVPKGGICGRCYFFSLEEGQQTTLDKSLLNGVSPGVYLLHAIYTIRTFTPPPFGNFEASRQTQAAWRDKKLNAPACRSVPVEVAIDDQGRIALPALNKEQSTLSTFEAQLIAIEDHEPQQLSLRYICPTSEELCDPFFRYLHASPSPVKLELDDGNGHRRVFSFREPNGYRNGWTYLSREHCILVPKNGVVGRICDCLPPSLPSGTYKLTVELDDYLLAKEQFSRNPRKPSMLVRSTPIEFRIR